MAENKDDKTSKTTNSYVEFLKKKLEENTKKAKEQTNVKLPSPERADGKVSKSVKPEKTDEQSQSFGGSLIQHKVEEPAWKNNIKDENRSSKTKIRDEKTAKERKSVLKTLGIVALSFVLVVGLIVGGYFAYLQISYSRIEDMKYLDVQNNQSSKVVIGKSYSISTFNIGFGAYGQSYSFFMDEGEFLDGTKTKGSSARAVSKEDVINNITGSINLLKNSAVSDFYFFQEVDTDSTRSFYVNQLEMLQNSFLGYSSVFAKNAHSSYMFYPLSQPTGTMNSGILTMSKFTVDYAVRRKLEIETGMINKLFDLDRCFSVTKLPISGSADKDLVLINVHLSAYDDGGIREEQIALLYDYMDFEYNTNGNYVIVGGDFNLSLAGDAGVFNNQMKTPSWCKNLPVGYGAENFKSIGYNINYDISQTTGTCRDASVKYVEGVNLEVIIDGFMTSENIAVIKTMVVDGDFKNSDHNPVRMEFVLN